MEKTIYAMQHNVTKRIYVGSCNNADIRIKKHIHDLLRGCHTNKELQKDFDKYGMEFSFYHIDRVQADKQFEQERKWQNALRSNEKTTGYNLSKQEKPITDLSKFQRIYLTCVRGVLAGCFEFSKSNIENELPPQSFLKLEALVDARNVTFYAVAKELGFAPTVFSDWKSGKSMPKTDKLIKIADYFGVPVEYFYS